MNRAQRRLAGYRQRPAGQFLGELQRQGLNRAYQAQMRAQMIEEANGKPIDPEVAALMTREKQTEQLFQVMVPIKGADGATEMMRASPMMGHDACGVIAESINRSILEGNRADRKGWGLAEVLPMQRIEGAA